MAQPGGSPSLEIRFAGGQNKFHVGERIPVDLAFLAGIPDKYTLALRDDAHQGLESDVFHVVPSSPDPLEQFFSGSLIDFFGGDQRAELSSEPRTLHSDANSRLSLRKVGHYSLQVISSRVSHKKDSVYTPDEVTSNTLDFDIVPADLAWQQETLASAIAVFDNPSSDEQQVLSALRTIRYMDSPASIRELVRQLGKLSFSQQWDCEAGLAASLNQRFVVDEMERQLSVPDVAVTASYISLLARLKVQLTRDPLLKLSVTDKAKQEEWQERMRLEWNEMLGIQEDLYLRTAQFVSSKQGTAKTATVRALLEFHAPEVGTKPATVVADEDTAAAFTALTGDEQERLLSGSADRLKGASMVKALQQVVQQHPVENQGVRDRAFRRLYELDAEKGRVATSKKLSTRY